MTAILRQAFAMTLTSVMAGPGADVPTGVPTHFGADPLV